MLKRFLWTMLVVVSLSMLTGCHLLYDLLFYHHH